MKLIAVTGGIGSGKSVVCRILSVMGYPVYDCDSRAKVIMDNSDAIKKAIKEIICNEAIVTDSDGACRIDRRALAATVFSDRDKLNALNGLVHCAVREDIADWRQRLSRSQVAFVETAILTESGLDKVVDAVWEVTAPTELRIARAMKRDNSCRESVEARVANQRSLSVLQLSPSAALNYHEIVNDDTTPLMPQLLSLLAHIGD
jgi:dephospho-CoA kinase